MMNKLNYFYRFFPVCLILLLLHSTNLLADKSTDGKIYVWEFATRDGERNDYTRSLTEEFEEALIQANCCDVLQRRQYARLFDQKQNEKGIMTLDGAPNAVIHNLRSLEAETVVFGVMYDDSYSGRIKITINFEAFNGRIMKKASTYLAKYDIDDPEERESAIGELLNKLRISYSSGRVIETASIDDWEFSITGCRRSADAVTCSYKVRSRNRDRSIVIYSDYNSNYYSWAQDEFSYDYRAKEVKLANNQGTQYVEKFLAADVEAAGNIRFLNVAPRASSFSILSFYVKGTNLERRSIRFRNVKIE